MLGDSWDKVLQGGHYVRQHLEDPIFMDAVSIGSYAHRPRWIWTNLAPSPTLATSFFAVLPPFDQKVDDILDPNRTFLPVVRDDLPPLVLTNNVGASRMGLSHLYEVSKVIRLPRLGVGYGVGCAMGFHISTTATFGLFEGQRRFVLGQAMDLHSMMWTVSLCLALQRHHDDQLLSMGAEDTSRGA